MNKKILLLVSLLFITQLTCATHDKKIIEKLDSVEKVVLQRELKGIRVTKCCGELASSSFDNPDTLCCKRGKRGKKGKRGHTGPAGTPSDPGINEFFINAEMMWYGVFEGPEIFFPQSVTVYESFPQLAIWNMPPSVGMNFNVPNDLDNTKPVTAVIHLLVDNSEQTPGNAQYQIQVDYQPDGGVFSGNFAETEDTGDFAVTPPPVSGNQWRQIDVPVLLNNTLLVPGYWAFMTVGRIPATTNDYSGDTLLSTVSIQYSRLP